MYTVYILESIINKRLYIGHTKDTEKRLGEHNRGKVKSTKAYRPWKILYTEEAKNKQVAFKREMQIKSFKHGESLKKLLHSQNNKTEESDSGLFQRS